MHVAFVVFVDLAMVGWQGLILWGIAVIFYTFTGLVAWIGWGRNMLLAYLPETILLLSLGLLPGSVFRIRGRLVGPS